MKRHHRVAAAVLALCGSASALAAGPLVVQGSASISDLQLSVSDFRPDDGVTAAATLITRGMGNLNTNCCDYEMDSFDSRVLHLSADSLTQASTARVAMTGGNLSAKRTADGAVVQMGIDKDQFESVYIYTSKWESNSVGASASVSLNDYQLELAPGTEIHLSGHTTADAWLDMGLQEVQGSVEQYWPVRTEVNVSTHFGVSPKHGSSGLEFLIQPQGDSAFAGGEVSQIRKQGVITSDAPTQLHESASFLYVIRNVSTQSQILDVRWSAEASASAYLYGVPVVPEPETWALLMGGLLALGAFARRRQTRVAVCTAALMAPVLAQAVPVVSAEGSMVSIDALGEAEGGYRIESQTQAFYANTDSYYPYDYGGKFYFTYGQAGAQSHYLADGGLRVFAGAQKGSNAPAQSKAWAQLEWTDVVTNNLASSGVATLSFSTFQNSYAPHWATSKDSHFKATVWLDGQTDQPVWFSALDTVTNAAGETSWVLSGSDIGLQSWGGGGFDLDPRTLQISLGSLASGQSRSVHFKIEMSMADGYSDSAMYFETSAPGLTVSAVSSVPEPSSWLLGSLGVLACAGLARRGRGRANAI